MLLLYLSVVASASDKDWVTQQYELLNKRLLGYAYSRSKDVQWSRDIVQEVFLVLLSDVQKYNKMSNDEIDAYCFTIVRHGFYRHCKQNARYGDLELLDTDLTSFAQDEQTEQVAMKNLEYEKMKRAVDQLPEPLRTMITLKYELGRTHAEIAKDLGISESRSQNLLAKAIGQLRQAMEVGEDHE